MRPLSMTLTAFLLVVGQIQGGGQGKIVQDLWDVAYLQGGRAGYVHTMVRESEKNGVKVFSAVQALNLTVKRNKDIINLRMDTGNTETANGKVLGVFMRQYLGQNKQLEITGLVSGKQLRLTLDKVKELEPAPWDDSVLGLVGQQRLLAEHKAKPGDKIFFKSFEPTINLVIKNEVEVKDFEDVELLGKTRKRLLRVRSSHKNWKTFSFQHWYGGWTRNSSPCANKSRPRDWARSTCSGPQKPSPWARRPLPP